MDQFRNWIKNPSHGLKVDLGPVICSQKSADVSKDLINIKIDELWRTNDQDIVCVCLRDKERSINVIGIQTDRFRYVDRQMERDNVKNQNNTKRAFKQKNKICLSDLHQ